MRSGWAGSLVGVAAAGLSLTVPRAFAGSMYTITDLGTLPGTTRSVATGINDQGQVVGVSYSGSGPTQAVGSLAPLSLSYDSGAQSFLYSNGQTTQINPTGGLANAINDAGQVVGGQYSSINNAGQYVGGPGSALVTNNNQRSARRLEFRGFSILLQVVYWKRFAENLSP